VLRANAEVGCKRIEIKPKHENQPSSTKNEYFMRVISFMKAYVDINRYSPGGAWEHTSGKQTLN